ncbi:MAG: toll/interleukin-1 receptor domain-containing protein [Deltaproteobacteria bacterium]|nr:toll/interleukin-1 receptor domain-containing protein [Deltaproteobacteria bacterium]
MPPKLHRVFRDEDELPTSADLKENIHDALVASRFLIVICSPSTPDLQVIDLKAGRGERALSQSIKAIGSVCNGKKMFGNYTELGDI